MLRGGLLSDSHWRWRWHFGCFGFAIGFEVATEGAVEGGRRRYLELELGAGVGVVGGTFCIWYGPKRIE